MYSDGSLAYCFPGLFCGVYFFLLCLVDVGIAVGLTEKIADFVKTLVKRWKEKRNEKK